MIFLTKRAALLCVAVGLAIGVALKLFIIDIVHIKGTSMEPTIPDGSFVLIQKFAYGLCAPFGDTMLVQWDSPREGDIILYLYEDNTIIKRCAACPGTPLDYSSDSGYTVTAAGTAYPLTESQYHRLLGIDRVPEGTVLAIGDNAAHSIDSRSYGFIPIKNIVGKAVWK